jgi:hypothetical protein
VSSGDTDQLQSISPGAAVQADAAAQRRGCGHHERDCAPGT